MKYKDFEDFLAYQHADEYMGTDDDMFDYFIDWMGGLDGEEWLEYGDAYAKTFIK